MILVNPLFMINNETEDWEDSDESLAQPRATESNDDEDRIRLMRMIRRSVIHFH